jgi:hypothetical protein
VMRDVIASIIKLLILPKFHGFGLRF